MTYAVSQRTREIGIRIALGGRVRDVMLLVLRQGLGMALAGLALGTVLGLISGRLVARVLFGVSGADPATFLLTLAVLVVVALLATLIPARRAARVSPMVAIRYDQAR
jgi:putative ABC transport system permease protein